MHDVQGELDTRNVPLDHVGVSGLRYPIVVLDRGQGKQQTVAELQMSVDLPQEFKGTHMSRFVEILEEYRGEITMHTMPELLETLRGRLNAASARVIVKFPYFMQRSAPVSGASALVDYECSFVGSVSNEGRDFVLGVRVPVTSLCPCSKAISDYGAHNQRGILDLRVRATGHGGSEPEIIWIEELIEIAEASASAPVYALLKRSDERYVTMQAYDNPVFVEDMVRNVAVALRADRRVGWFEVHAENVESIHNHSAFAQTEWRRA